MDLEKSNAGSGDLLGRKRRDCKSWNSGAALCPRETTALAMIVDTAAALAAVPGFGLAGRLYNSHLLIDKDGGVILYIDVIRHAVVSDIASNGESAIQGHRIICIAIYEEFVRRG